jgi:hypothetical protein
MASMNYFLINFTEDDQPIFKQPKGPITRRAARKRIEPTNESIELERGKLALVLKCHHVLDQRVEV